jgi:peptidyl-tRNA hydrolase
VEILCVVALCAMNTSGHSMKKEIANFFASLCRKDARTMEILCVVALCAMNTSGHSMKKNCKFLCFFV